MTTVKNRIPSYAATFETIGISSSWQIQDGSMIQGGTSNFLTGYQVLKVSLPSTNPQTPKLTIDVNLTSSDVNRPMTFTCFARCITGGSIQVKLTNLAQLSNTVTSTTQLPTDFARQNPGTLADGGWAIVRSGVLTPVDIGTAPTIRIELTINANNTGSTLVLSSEPYIYLAVPVLTGTYDFQNNISAEEAFGSLPQVMRDYEESSSPDYPLFRLLDVLTFSSNIAATYANEWTYVDYIDGYDETSATKSKLVDPEVTPLSALPWLNQFLGSRRASGRVTKTPWGSIPATWAGMISNMDISPANGLVSWEEFETYAPSFADAEEVQRWQATTGFSGIRAGSLEAVKSAVKLVLTGTKNVSVGPMQFTIVSNKYVPSWKFTLTTKVSETPDVTSVLDESKLVEGMIEFAKPVGIQIIHALSNS